MTDRSQLLAPDDVLDAEVVDEPTVAALAPVEASTALVKPAAGLEQVEQAFRDYTALCGRLLTPEDHQRIGNKNFRKKSAWRKLAVAFGVTCEIRDRSYEREGRQILRAEVVVRATAPNGRFMDGLGACDLYEKCCPPNCKRRRYNDHTCCTEDCPGTVHFSNPQHDIPATAATRATNRACADLFGMGEVSAEEITDHGAEEHRQESKTVCKRCKQRLAGSGKVEKDGDGYVHEVCPPPDDSGRPFTNEGDAA